MKFWNLPVTLAAMCALALLAVPVAHATVTPVSGIPIVLEHDPAGIAIPPVATNVKGDAVFLHLAAGRYLVFLPDASVLKARARISAGVTGEKPLVSAPIKPGHARFTCSTKRVDG